MCLNTDQSECNGTPTTTPPPLTLHRGGCHMLRSGHSEAHMPPQETSKNSPRAPQSWARLTYSLPSPPHTYLNSGAELWFHHAGLKKKSAGAWWLSFLRCSGIESISAISPRYVLATSTKQTLKEWRAVRPPVCTQSITPPQWTQAGNRLQLSNPHNTQCRAAERNTNSNTFSNCLVTWSLSLQGRTQM